MTAATIEPTYYEVVWGDDEADRVMYVDYHDGTYTSETAKNRADACWLRMTVAGTRCGLFKAGVLIAGTAPEPTIDDSDDEPAEPSVEHKTRTILHAYQSERYVTKSNGSCGRFVRSDTATAHCTCGWTWHAGSRAEARSAARWHRSQMAAT